MYKDGNHGAVEQILQGGYGYAQKVWTAAGTTGLSLLLWGACMGNDSILPECGGLSDYSDTKERKEMTQGQMVSFYLRFRFGHSYVPDNSYSWGTYFFPPYLPGRVSIKGSILSG